MDENLLKALLAKLENVLNGGEDDAQSSVNNYIAWCSPGIPFQPEDLQFAIKGLNGENADETATLVRNAAEFSRIANSIPSSNKIGGTFEQNGSTLWSVYKNVLIHSHVKADEITDEEKEKIERLRSKLVTKKIVTDPVTDEEKEITVDSPIVVAYNEKMNAYINAVAEYNNKRLSALNADDKKAFQDFALNADNYRRLVKSAMRDWVSNGFKEDIEKIGAFIQQVSQRSMTLVKEELKDRMDRSKMTDAITGNEFYFSSLYPGDFINSNRGWTEFSFKSSAKNDFLKEDHSSTNVTAGIKFGLWKANANANHTQDKIDKSLDTNDFEMKFKITQATIGRGWFDSDFLTSGLWTWKPENGMLSDGEIPPHGSLIAYPTTAVFIKDIEITSSGLKDASKDIKSTLDAGGSVGWGPFNATANRHEDHHDSSRNFNEKTNTLHIEGMQLIAFKCFALPKTPDCKVKDLE